MSMLYVCTVHIACISVQLAAVTVVSPLIRINGAKILRARENFGKQRDTSLARRILYFPEGFPGYRAVNPISKRYVGRARGRFAMIWEVLPSNG